MLRFCHCSDIDKKGHNGFYYAVSYLDPIKRDLATIAAYHLRQHAGSHNFTSTMAAREGGGKGEGEGRDEE